MDTFVPGAGDAQRDLICAVDRIQHRTADSVHQAGRGVFLPGRLRRPGQLLWQVRDDDHPFVIGGQRLPVLAVAGHGGESGGE
jgi:hypothetical protein